MSGSISGWTKDIEARIDGAQLYMVGHPEWRGSTVDASLRDLRQGARNLRGLEAVLTGTNAYADGPRRDLDQAFETLARELDSRVRVWREPLEEEQREAAEQARADRELRQKLERIQDPQLRAECLAAFEVSGR